MNFHLPYHFVPVEAPSNGIQSETLGSGESDHVTHDRYLPNTSSGRIVCRLSTVTPVFVGAKREDGQAPVKVQNYTLGGQIALPASSLRGMVSSLAEAASNSAMRVFDGKARYSVRKPLEPEHVLSAIGVILVDAAGGFQLQPICIPTLRADRDGTAALPKPFWKLFPEPNLKVYIGNAASIRRKEFRFRTFDFEKPLWYALPLERRKWLSDFRLADDEFQHRKPISSRGYVLGQVPLKSNLDPVPVEEVRRLSEDERRSWRAGVVRVLGCWDNREESMPPGKKHEIFLPWPENGPVVPIPQAVVDEFHDICDARTEASLKPHKRDQKHPLLPFEPRDTRPGREGKSVADAERPIRLKKGDLVYFGVDSSGTVNEISFSAIWRKAVRKGVAPATASDFFPAELSPFSYKRATLSEAELLFGFVEDIKGRPPERQEQALALASRVRFSAALPVGEIKLMDEVTLKVLDTPKPPCPSLYFKPRGNVNGEFIPKVQLDAARHEAQGRKFYLHQLSQDERWRSTSKEANKDQQCSVQPIPAKQAFYFHIDFDNLSDKELGLLIYALCPSERFLHKLGMGKGIGLGSVRLEPLALLEIDRSQRYTPEGLKSPRYHRAQRGPTELGQWPESYAPEKQAATAASPALLSIRDGYRKGMKPTTRQAIELIGDPTYIKAAVLPPLIQGQDDPEAETFKWFVANETGIVDRPTDREIQPQKQFLRPLTGRKDLPVFTQPEWRPRGRR